MRYLNAVLVQVEEMGAFWGNQIRIRPERRCSGRTAPESDTQKTARLQTAATERRVKAHEKAEAAIAYDLRRLYYYCEDAGGTDVVSIGGDGEDPDHSEAILEIISSLAIEKKVVPPILFGAEDRLVFEAFLSRFAHLPVETAEELLKESARSSAITIDSDTLAKVARYNAGESDTMSLELRCAYEDLQKAVNLVAGVFTVECGFFSQPDNSTILTRETRNRIAESPENYALVFLHIHI